MKPIISPNTRIRHPEHFSVEEFSVIDDFSYFSTKVKVGRHCHIASGCSVAGGLDYTFSLGSYSSISSGVKIWCKSNDFTNDLVVLNPEKKNLGDKSVTGNVVIGEMCGIGANTVIMPNNSIPDGVVIGALSFVPENFKFKKWSVYAGAPIKFIKKRNKKNVVRQMELLK